MDCRRQPGRINSFSGNEKKTDIVESTDQKLGTWGLPGTFPTGKVKSHLNETTPGWDWTRKIINDIYQSYKKAILEKGYKPYLWKDAQGTHFEVRDFIVQDTGIDEILVASVLIAIYELAQAGEIPNQYWNIVKQKEATAGLPDIADLFKRYTTTLKWGSILALVSIGLWFSWPVIKKIRQRMR